MLKMSQSSLPPGCFSLWLALCPVELSHTPHDWQRQHGGMNNAASKAALIRSALYRAKARSRSSCLPLPIGGILMAKRRDVGFGSGSALQIAGGGIVIVIVVHTAWRGGHRTIGRIRGSGFNKRLLGRRRKLVTMTLWTPSCEMVMWCSLGVSLIASVALLRDWGKRNRRKWWAWTVAASFALFVGAGLLCWTG